jgi:hypothetical protein
MVGLVVVVLATTLALGVAYCLGRKSEALRRLPELVDTEALLSDTAWR